MKETAGTITLEEFLHLPDDGHRDEVSRGRLIREPQPGDQHGAISVELVTILNNWLKEHPVGKLRTHSGLRERPAREKLPSIWKPAHTWCGWSTQRPAR